MKTTNKYSQMLMKEIKNCFEYDEKTGRLFWAEGAEGGKARHQLNEDDYAGYVNTDGYYRVQLYGVEYMGARVVWAWHNGEWPEGRLRYLDSNRANTRIGNLEVKQ